MNIVEVSGGKIKEREIVEAAVHWCIKKLMPRVKSLEIEVAVKNIPVHGYCMMTDSNRHFDLEIKKGLNLFDLISTVCHEMVHVKQYYRKELTEDHRWKSREISKEVTYLERPWEKEAFDLEESLAVECFKKINVIL